MPEVGEEMYDGEQKVTITQTGVYGNMFRVEYEGGREGIVGESILTKQPRTERRAAERAAEREAAERGAAERAAAERRAAERAAEREAAHMAEVERIKEKERLRRLMLPPEQQERLEREDLLKVADAAEQRARWDREAEIDRETQRQLAEKQRRLALSPAEQRRLADEELAFQLEYVYPGHAPNNYGRQFHGGKSKRKSKKSSKKSKTRKTRKTRRR
jgi:hypothetical protein